MMILASIVAGAAMLGVIVKLAFDARHRRSRFTHRPLMPPEQFLSGIDTMEASKDVILGVRAGVAEATGLAADALYPSDSFEDLLQLGFDGMDFIEVLMGIEKTMNVRLRRDLVAEEIERIAGGSMNFTLIDFAQRCAKSWDSFTEASL